MLAGTPLSCLGGSGHWCSSFSLALATSLAGGGDFFGEVVVLGLGAWDPDWASMLACSFRTRSSSSFCRGKGQRSQRLP